MNEVRGYKVFNPDWTCRNFQYEVGKTYTMKAKPVICQIQWKSSVRLQSLLHHIW